MHPTLESFFLNSSSGRPILRLGVMLDNSDLPLWNREILNQIARSNHSTVACLLWDSSSVTSAPSISSAQNEAELPGTPAHNRSFRNYVRLDRRLYGQLAQPDPEQFVRVSDLLDGVPVIPMQARAVEAGHRGTLFTSELKTFDLDVVLDWRTVRSTSSRPGASAEPRKHHLLSTLEWRIENTPIDILRFVKHGVWSYHHGDGAAHRGGPPAFWEMVDGSPVTGVLLQRLRHSSEPSVLVSGFTSTRPGSLVLNRFDQCWLAYSFVVEKLFALHQYGSEFLDTELLSEPIPNKGGSRGTPGIVTIARYLSKTTAGKVVRRLKTSQGELAQHWRIGLRSTPTGLDVLSGSPDLAGFQWLEAPAGHLWADPFIQEKAGECWVLFEDYEYRKGYGVITAALLDENGGTQRVETALDTGSHLSYPFVFKENEEYFLLPESASAGTLTLYHAVDFPTRWERVCDLGPVIPALDTTVWRENGVYWFFLTTRPQHGAGYQLLLFFSDSLTGKWVQHPMSPITHDIRNARSAGALFRSGGRLIRPSQDCSVRYGRALHFQEIVSLTESEYAVRPLLTIEPGMIPGAPERLEGIHTYNRSGRFEVIDGVRTERLSKHSN